MSVKDPPTVRMPSSGRYRNSCFAARHIILRHWVEVSRLSEGDEVMENEREKRPKLTIAQQDKIISAMVDVFNQDSLSIIPATAGLTLRQHLQLAIFDSIDPGMKVDAVARLLMRMLDAVTEAMRELAHG